MIAPDKKYILPLVHIVIWLCLFFYPFLFHYLSLSDIRAVSRIALLLLLMVLLFYGNTFILIPKLLGKKKVLLYLISALTLIVGISFAGGYLQMLFNPEYASKPQLFKAAANAALIVSVLTWFISSGIKVTSEWLKNQQRMRIIENEKLNAELNFLKSQVNPHFLFNALNNIYSMETKKSPETGPAILKLSELVRYLLYETSTEFVSLQDEVNYLKNYIELQKLSLSHEVKVTFETGGDFSDKKIEPMLLIPLVENVFKHGISYKNHSDLFISVKTSGGALELSTLNQVTGKQKQTKESQGIGLTNLKQRLSLLYPGEHELVIDESNGMFKARLKIQLK